MGSPDSEKERDADEGPLRQVAIRSFAMGKMEVTFDQYDACTTDRACPRLDDNGWGRGERPAINVDWNGAKSYTEWLSRKTGKP